MTREHFEDLVQWVFIATTIGSAAIASVYFWTTVAGVKEKIITVDSRVAMLHRLFLEIVMHEILNQNSDIEACSAMSPHGNKCSRNASHINHDNAHANIHACYDEKGEIIETWPHEVRGTQ